MQSLGCIGERNNNRCVREIDCVKAGIIDPTPDPVLLTNLVLKIPYGVRFHAMYSVAFNVRTLPICNSFMETYSHQMFINDLGDSDVSGPHTFEKSFYLPYSVNMYANNILSVKRYADISECDLNPIQFCFECEAEKGVIIVPKFSGWYKVNVGGTTSIEITTTIA